MEPGQLRVASPRGLDVAPKAGPTLCDLEATSWGCAGGPHLGLLWPRLCSVSCVTGHLPAEVAQALLVQAGLVEQAGSARGSAGQVGASSTGPESPSS